ncbi:MAG: O-antigen ligase family protein [Candidatus Promineifilaceae bacterium]
MTDHQGAVHLGLVVVLAGAVWLYNVSWQKRLVLMVAVMPILLTIIAGQRRSAFVALLVAFALLAIILFLEHRTAFFLIVPPLAILGLAYIGVFWNSSNPLGGPAQAIKSVVAEDQADEHDRTSNEYRKIENLNSRFTIHQAPLTGVGFGNKFFIVIPMADISGFIWWEYMTHNSVVYIWIKSGVGGFLALLWLVGQSIVLGVRATMRINIPFLKAIALTATMYVIMHFIYAYVDISWEAQGMVLLGVMLGLLNCIESILMVDSTTYKRRWPWQPEIKPPAPILPFPG